MADAAAAAANQTQRHAAHAVSQPASVAFEITLELLKLWVLGVRWALPFVPRNEYKPIHGGLATRLSRNKHSPPRSACTEPHVVQSLKMSGFDLNQIGNMAQGFMNNNNNQQGGNNNNNNNDDHNNNQQHGGGGFNFGQLAGLAQNFSSGNHDSSLFSQAASFVQNQGGNQNVDEQQLVQDHKDVNNNSGSNSSGQIGNAAA